MKEVTGLTRAEVMELYTARAKTDDPPNIGTHIRGGRHVEMPESWNGVGKVPIGWTGVDGPHQEEEYVEYTETIDDGYGGTKNIQRWRVEKKETYAISLQEDLLARVQRYAASNDLTAEEASLLRARYNAAVAKLAEPEPEVEELRR